MFNKLKTIRLLKSVVQKLFKTDLKQHCNEYRKIHFTII